MPGGAWRTAALLLSLATGAGGALLGLCGPFTDVAADAFCPFVLEIFYLGITTGTTPTTYDPASNVSRLQMAAFLSRTVDGALLRGSRRAALDQFWTPQSASVVGLTTVGANPQLLASDGADVWSPNFSGTVSRVRASDGRLLETWTGAAFASGVVVAMGSVFITKNNNPGALYRIDPGQPAGAVTTVATNLDGFPAGIAFDGARLWVADTGPVSIVTPGATLPWTVTNVSAGFSSAIGAVYDGANIWVTDNAASKLLKLDPSGGVLMTVTVASQPLFPAFDGGNIWVPSNAAPSVTVVRASTGTILATLTGNGLANPSSAAFDGRRVLVTSPSTNAVSLFKAADLTPLGTFAFASATSPVGVCSDGVNFWISLGSKNLLARF